MAMAHQSSLCQLYQLGGCCCQQKLRAWLHSVPATKVSMAVSFTSTWVRSNCKSRLILLRDCSATGRAQPFCGQWHVTS